MNVKQTVWILMALLWSVATWAEPVDDHPCGLRGSVEDRIKDCGGGVMKLVTRTESGKEVKMDDTGLLWGDRREDGPRNNGYFTFDEAQTVCMTVTESEGNLTGLKWRLPTPQEFGHIGRENQNYWNERGRGWFEARIKGNGSWIELPHMNDRDGYYWYWTSLLDSFFAWDSAETMATSTTTTTTTSTPSVAWRTARRGRSNFIP